MIDDLRNTVGARGSTYSDIRDNSKLYVGIMSTLGVKFPEVMDDTAAHCLSNIATKLSRLGCGAFNHEDSILDIAGYAVIWLAAVRRAKPIYAATEGTDRHA